MPASISGSPFVFDFANNSIKFTLLGTPVAIAGQKAVSRYKIITMPRANYHLSIAYGTKKYFFYFRNTAIAQTNPYEIYLYSAAQDKKNELIKKIAQNYYIEKDYVVTVSDTLEIVFTARQNGGEKVTLNTSDDAANIQLVSQTTGIAKTEKEGYKLFAKLEVTRFAINSTKLYTPEILLHIDTNNRASLPLSMLRSYFQSVDAPGLSQKFAAYSLKNAMFRCRLIFSDYFDGVVQMLKYSADYYFVNGKISEAHRVLNLPDWNCPMGDDKKLNNFARPRSYGSPSGLTLKSYHEFPQYAYFMFFNVNAASNATSSLQFRVNILNENGSAKNNINPGTLTFSNYSIVRVPLSVNALSLQTHSTQIISYTVRVYHSDAPSAVWTRTFVLQQKPFHAKEFLLQNRYGVLESFFIDHEMTEKSIDGEKVTCEGKIEIDVHDISTTFTARTGNKSDFEMKLLAEALENRHHYKVVNNALIPITILPDSLTIFDEGEDLQSAEFQYSFKIPDKTVPATAIVSVIGHDVFAEVALESTWNETKYRVWNDNLFFEEETNTTLTLES